MHIHHRTLFPSIVTEVECDFYSFIQPSLIEWIYNYQKTTDGVVHSNRGGWQSPSDFYLDKSFDQFTDYILKNALMSLKHYNLDFKLVNMWININKKWNYNTKHCHPGCILSGVFWVKAPENCGKLVFVNPHSFVEHNLIERVNDDVKKECNYDRTFEFTPQEGTLVTFPSHLQHLVEPNQSDEDRISIAFNLS